MSADRELRAETTIAASPAAVWSVLSDMGRMPEWSPELIRIMPMKRGGLRVGQWYLGVNRRGAVVWPTRSIVVTVEPGKAIAWDTTSSGARWIYELTPEGEGTRVVHRRPVTERLTTVSTLFAGALLGGAEGHADELEDGMARTLERIKAAVES